MHSVETRPICLAELGGFVGMEARSKIRLGQAKCPIRALPSVRVSVEILNDKDIGKAALDTGEFPDRCPLCKVELLPHHFRDVTPPAGPPDGYSF